MESQQKKEITLTLDAAEALKLYAFLTEDDSIPWGIDEGRQVASQLVQNLKKFLGR